MDNKLNLALLFGGQSHEHEVSVTSARAMLSAIDVDRYSLALIGINKSGNWCLFDSLDVLELGPSVDAIARELPSAPTPVWLDYVGGRCLRAMNSDRTWPIDVFFPLLHGPCGEDGTIQGVFELAGVAYVGCGVAASGVAMDKVLMKAAFQSAALNQLPYRVVHRHQWSQSRVQITDKLIDELAGPHFVKPANMGSSVGVSKAHGSESLMAAVDEALQYDNKILVETSAEDCREIECGVLGSRAPEASVIGEIIPGSEFYDYQTKYVNDRSQYVIPAQLSDRLANAIRRYAIGAFQCVGADGLARVDFFVNSASNEIWVNEINTMPGFTPISMYPKLWMASGVDYPALVARLIDLGLQRQKEKDRLKSLD